MRGPLITLAVLIVGVIAVGGGAFCGIVSADARWKSDMNRLDAAMRRLDEDIKSGRGPAPNGDYFLELSDLPLERVDDKSATYYVGPFAKHSATIEFDNSGVKGLRIE